LVWSAPAVMPRACAQGGNGPDPFRPYNSQYDPYIYPMGDVGPDSVQLRSGVRGANRFESYLNELEGASRARVEKYGIGVPYYRNAVDPRFLPPDREYVPNFKSSRSFERTQQVITEKYLAYFEERDPKKRSQLFRELNRAQANVGRALSTTGRRANPTRILEAADEAISSRRPASTRGDDDQRPGQAPEVGRRRGTADPGTEPPDSRRRSSRATGGATAIPPAPAPPGVSSGRSRRTPTDVLDRAQSLRNTDPLDFTVPVLQPRPSRRSRTQSNRANTDSRMRPPSAGDASDD
jgi:hypothetical protein